MTTTPRILLVAGADETKTWLAYTLAGAGYAADCVRVKDEQGCRAALAQQHWDAVVCAMPGADPALVAEAVRNTQGCADLALILLAPSFDELAGRAHRLGATICVRGAGPAQLVPAIERALDGTGRRLLMARQKAFEDGQRRILEQIASALTLPELLHEIVSLVERQAEGMLCSILLVDREQGVVRHGAAPSLPPEFSRAIDGAPIGPNQGSCGAAAYLAERVIVEDIATHPFWADYRHLALPHGLRACWSTPIQSANQEVLGTFAMYYADARGPSAREIAWVDHATYLATIAISRHRAEQTLRKNERLRALVNNAVSDVIFYIGVEPAERYRFLSINRAFLKATGLEEEQVTGRLVQEVIPPDSLDLVLTNYRTAIAERRTVQWHEVSAYPTGLRHGEVSITPIFDDAGVCTNLVGTVHDVTERRQAEERIRAQAALLDKAKDAILVRDLDGVIGYWNDGAARLYGWSSNEALGRSVTDLLYRDLGPFRQAQRLLVEHGEWRGEIAQLTKSGTELVVEASWTLLRDEQGHPKSVLAINSDITERKKLEAQVFRAQRMEGLGTLAGGIAHDFNNILMAILTNVELARSDLDAVHPAQDSLVEVERAGARATDLVRQILTFSRHQETKHRLIDLASVATEALALLRVTLPARIQVESRFPPGAPPVLADPSQIHQILMNLGTNAGHAMGERGGILSVQLDRVFLDAKLIAPFGELRTGHYVRIVVGDTGCGMDEATLERAFDPFFTTKPAGRGTGLGLSVVHGIMKNHDGGVVVHSVLGMGTTFELYFPAAEGVVETRGPRRDIVRGKGQHVLYLEDEDSILHATKRLLERLGYRVSAYSNGVRALQALQSAPDGFDVVVTDSSMPGLSGLELIHALFRVRADLRIVMISGLLSPEDQRAAQDLGVREFLAKPSSAEDLGRALDRVLRSHR